MAHSDMEQNTKSISGYIFDLQALCGGHAFYSTYAQWAGTSESKRQIRKPHDLLLAKFERMLYDLGQFGLHLSNDGDYQRVRLVSDHRFFIRLVSDHRFF